MPAQDPFTGTLERLVRALRAALGEGPASASLGLAEGGLPATEAALTPNLLRDILWLAQQLPATPALAQFSPPPSLPPAQLPPPDVDMFGLPQPDPQTVAGLAPPSPPSPVSGPTAALYAGGASGTLRAGLLRLPGVSATPRPLALRRALQPLARRVPSAVRWVLDEDATAERRADTGRWQLVQRPLRERWFDLNLVQDSGDSMALWREELALLQRALRAQGGFRSLRSFVLSNAPGAPALRLTRRPGGPTVDSVGLAPPGDRTLTLLATDGGSAHWRNGQASAWLHGAASHGPLTVLQLLPRRLWRHTPMGEPDLAGHWNAAGQPNTRLHSANADLQAAQDAGWRAVPAVTLDSAALRGWARAVTGRREVELPLWLVEGRTGIKIAVGIQTPSAADAHGTAPATAEPSAAERVARYRRRASPAAYDLAVFLSVPDPLTLAVMRLVQRTMLPDSGTAELAEFFLGGLLAPVIGPGRTTSTGNAAWRLHPGVRDELLHGLRYSEEDRIQAQLQRIGRVLQAQTVNPQAVVDVRAWFPDPQGSANLAEWAMPFAEVSRDILKGSQQTLNASAAAGDGLAPRAGVSALRSAALQIAVSDDNKLLATCGPDGNITLWKSSPGEPPSAWRQQAVTARGWFAFGPRGRVLAVAGADGAIALVPAADASEHTQVWTGGIGPLEAVAFSQRVGRMGGADGMVAVGGPDGRVAVVHCRDGRRGWLFQPNCGAVMALAFVGRDDEQVAVAGADGSLWLCDRKDSAMHQCLPATGSAAQCLAVVPGLGWLAVGDASGLLRLYRPDKPGMTAQAQTGAIGPVRGLAPIRGGQSRDGHWLSLDADGRLQRWHAETLRPMGDSLQTSPPAVALASAVGPDDAVIVLSALGELQRITLPVLGGATSPRAAKEFTFLDGESVVEAVRSSGRLAPDDTPVDRLLLFATGTQQTWLVFTRRVVVLLLDDADTRSESRLVQQVHALDQARPVDAKVDATGTGTVALGTGKGRWYYSRQLFATPALVQEAVLYRLDAAAGNNRSRAWAEQPIAKAIDRPGDSAPQSFAGRRRVFISYERRNAEQALRVTELLETLSLDGWKDMGDLTTGDDWGAAIEQAIAKAWAGIVLIDANWHRSSAAQREGLALLARKRRDAGFLLLPIRMDKQPLPPEWAHLQAMQGVDEAVLLSVLKDWMALDAVPVSPGPPTDDDPHAALDRLWRAHQQQAAAAGAQWMVFGGEVPPPLRTVAAECLLLAALAAERAADDSASAPADTKPAARWIDSLERTVPSLGFVVYMVERHDWTVRFSSDDAPRDYTRLALLTLHRPEYRPQDVGGSLALLRRVLVPDEFSAPWWPAFEAHSGSNGERRWMLNQIELASDGQLRLFLAAYVLSAPGRNPRQAKAARRADSRRTLTRVEMRATINPEHLAPLRPTLQERLGPQRLAMIRTIDEPSDGMVAA